MICKAAEIILTLSATFKGSADQQSVDAKTDFAFLGHDNLFSQIYMTPPERQTQVILHAQSISLIHCLFRLVKCKFTEPLYKSAWYTLLSLLIFSTYALSIKWEGRNLTEKKRKYRGCCGCCIPLRLCSSIARYCGYRDSPRWYHLQCRGLCGWDGCCRCPGGRGERHQRSSQLLSLSVEGTCGRTLQAPYHTVMQLVRMLSMVPL